MMPGDRNPIRDQGGASAEPAIACAPLDEGFR